MEQVLAPNFKFKPKDDGSEDDDEEDCENTNKFYLEDILKKINS